jgi:small-conductance mechanosensitive channel
MKQKAHIRRGLGNPHSSRNINPQHTLEAKKNIVRKAGGQMKWQGHKWIVKTPAKGATELTSKKLARYTLSSFKRVFGSTHAG